MHFLNSSFAECLRASGSSLLKKEGNYLIRLAQEEREARGKQNHYATDKFISSFHYLNLDQIEDLLCHHLLLHDGHLPFENSSLNEAIFLQDLRKTLERRKEDLSLEKHAEYISDYYLKSNLIPSLEKTLEDTIKTIEKNLSNTIVNNLQQWQHTFSMHIDAEQLNQLHYKATQQLQTLTKNLNLEKIFQEAGCIISDPNHATKTMLNAIALERHRQSVPNDDLTA